VFKCQFHGVVAQQVAGKQHTAMLPELDHTVVLGHEPRCLLFDEIEKSTWKIRG